MLQVEGRRAVRKSATANLDAFDSCLRGVWHFNQFAQADNVQAETWLRRAIALDPELAQGHMALSRTLNSRIWWAWSTDLRRDLAEATAAAQRAVALDDRDPYCHYAMVLVLLAARRHELAIAEAQRALDLSPNFALGYFGLGWVRVFFGKPAEAVDPLLRSLRLNPNDRQSDAFVGQLALAYYHLKNYEEAVRCAVGSLRKRRHPIRLAYARREFWAARPHRGRANRQPRTRLAQRGRRPLLGGHDALRRRGVAR